MKNLIKRILKENEENMDLGWVQDIIDTRKLNIPPGHLWYYANYGSAKNSTLKKNIIYQLASEFRDIEIKDTQIILKINSFCDFKHCFTGSDNSVQYGRVNSWLVEKIFCEEDDWWEPYHDTYGKWLTDIWEEMVLPDKKLYDHIIKHIKEIYVTPDSYNPKQLDIYGNLPKKRDIYYVQDLMSGGKDRILDDEYFEWLKNNPKALGELIDDDDNLIDLKRDLAFAYDDAYNGVARDNIYSSIKEEITDIFGEGNWESENDDRGRTRQFLKFDITDIFKTTVNNYFEYCFEWCLRGRELEDPEEYCDSCAEFEHYAFIELYAQQLDNSDQLWSPRFDEYPSRKEVFPYFSDSVYDRI